MYAYRTAKKTAEASYEINRSVFYAAISPAGTEKTATEFIRSRELAHPKASHHCYAYRISPNGLTARFSDAGEPSGTAGRPILSVMEANSVTNAAIVVSRYFGGVKLGAGGLLRAYSRSANMAIEACELAEFYSRALVCAVLPYEGINAAKRYLELNCATIKNEEYLSNASISFSIDYEAIGKAKEFLLYTAKALAFDITGECFEEGKGAKK